MSKHDESYKKFFSHPQMVKDLLCGFVDAPWVSQIDFSTLEKVNSEYITDKKLIKRVNDVVWKVRCQDQWLYIYILLEFQSKPDATMALRMMTYLSLLYLDLYETKQYTRDEISGYPKLPPVFPIVLYNGKAGWHKALDVNDLIVDSPIGLEPYRPHLRYCLIDENEYTKHELEALRNLVAALFRLEKGQNEEDMREVLILLVKWLDTPEQQSLNRAFATWLVEVALPKQHPDAKFPEINSLEGVNSMLAETIQGWYAEAEAKGMKKGEKIGAKRGEKIGEKRGEKRGWLKGKIEGKEEGKIEGNIVGQAKSLILLLETKFFSLSEDQRNSIFALEEVVIKKAMTYIFRASSIEDMFFYIDELDKT